MSIPAAFEVKEIKGEKDYFIIVRKKDGIQFTKNYFHSKEEIENYFAQMKSGDIGQLYKEYEVDLK